MIRTQVYLTEDQAREIKLRAKQENKAEAQIIRELLDRGRKASGSTGQESTGDALLRLASLGEKLHIKASRDLSSRIDDILYGED